MSKPCKKIKNPCKLCLGPVTRKNGLQCQGFCQCWIHYACLNYTPGKIKDIKAGIIHVNCPCPDCNSSQPKEFRSDEPFSCTNMKCPANTVPKCDNTECPINKSQDQKYGIVGNVKNTAAGSGCPLDKCSKECKEYKTASNQLAKGKCGNSSGPPCKETCATSKPGTLSPPKIPAPTVPFCPSGCSLPPGDLEQPSGPTPGLEEMCNTVGQLTNQIKDLMQQMKYVVQGKNGGSSNKQSAKSCHCPDNPCKR